MNELDKVAENVLQQCGCIRRNIDDEYWENIKILIAEYSQLCDNYLEVKRERDEFVTEIYSLEGSKDSE